MIILPRDVVDIYPAAYIGDRRRHPERQQRPEIANPGCGAQERYFVLLGIELPIWMIVLAALIVLYLFRVWRPS